MHSKDKIYRAAIIGAGRIAAGFDTPQHKDILTHAHAFVVHPCTSLVGLFDIDKSKATKVAKKWSTKSFKTVEDMLKKTEPEIVSVCTPDNTHYAVLKSLVKYRPKLVICEKPLTTKLDDTEKIINQFESLKIPLLVNYSRRFDRTLQKFRKEIGSNKYGKVIATVGYYSKGILHNGSHLIDLSRWFFGDVMWSQVLSSLVDYRKDDPTVSAVMSFERCSNFYLVGGDERKYGIFELDILFEKARFRIKDFGFSITTQKISKDKLYPEFKVLDQEKFTPTLLGNAMFELVSNVVYYLDRKTTHLVCDGQDALKVQRICHNLLKKNNICRDLLS